MAYKNENQGVTFINPKKEKETDPIEKGEATIEGVDYWMSVFENTSKQGVVYHKYYFNKKQERTKPEPVKKEDQWTGQSEETIPF